LPLVEPKKQRIAIGVGKMLTGLYSTAAVRIQQFLRRY